VCFFGSFFAQAKNEHLHDRTAINVSAPHKTCSNQQTTRPGQKARFVFDMEKAKIE
jgi:hypothetical protein